MESPQRVLGRSIQIALLERNVLNNPRSELVAVDQVGELLSVDAAAVEDIAL